MCIRDRLGTTNDTEAVEADGVRRSINRGRVDLFDMPNAQDDPWRWRIFSGLCALTRIRRSSPAFHPEGAQEVSDLGGVLKIERTSPDGATTATVLVNLCDTVVAVDGDEPLAPYESRWLL